jgi:hypothetical protein
MNKLKILTFASGNFIESKDRLIQHLYSIGINNFIFKSSNDLSNEFKNKYDYLLSQKRGYGYWIWKPYIILEELKKLNDDEILIYIDSTDLPEKLFFDIVLEHFKNNDILLTNRGYKNGEWTKRDCFVLMDCDNDIYYNSTQLEAGLICFKKTEFNIKLVEEWFNFMGNENILTDLPNICKKPNQINFKDHRHDQSILTNLSIKYNLKSYYFPNYVVKYNYNQPKIYG